VEVAATGSTADVFGIECYCGDTRDAARRIADRAKARAGGYACFCNVHVAVSARHDERLRDALAGAWAVFPDGAPIAWFERKTGHPGAARVAGPDVLPLVVEAGADLGLRHFLLGSTDAVLERLQRRLCSSYPRARVVGTAAPAVSLDEPPDARLVEEIRRTRPDIVWCALGAPKQELWMRANAPSLAPSLLLGVGAAFQFLAGTKRRAPRAVQALGLEWLHRLASEPRRLGGRYLRTNTEFATLVLRYALTELR
jgi:N-acetylglucosaminyldiphosphoundecaprenol N-acetyl-beta-D-mannosaminyltransferase